VAAAVMDSKGLGGYAVTDLNMGMGVGSRRFRAGRLATRVFCLMRRCGNCGGGKLKC
jgi:hypothetical protein